MDAVNFSESSRARLRLSSFFGSPSQNNQDLHLSNSPIKLAEAGFERQDNAVSDEVFCKHCGLTYIGWDGESPLAVHRILRPNCPFLNPTPLSETDSDSELPLSQSQNHDDHNTLLSPSFLSSSFIENMLSANVNTSNSNARRQLFTTNVQSSSPKLFRPKHRLGFIALFESHRLLTFLNPFSSEAAIYAKCGFVFNCKSSHAMCVFCNIELELITNCSEIRVEMLHESKAPTCRFVRGVDVGNISRECERVVRDKVRDNSFCCSVDDHIERCCGNREFVIKHPEFEDITSRIGTFNSWPMLVIEEFPSEEMAECGFYYTGLMDSVRCYCCGVGLRNWSKGTDPYIQHSRASQYCLHMLQLRGQDFINDAQETELTVDVDYGEMSSTHDSDSDSDTGSTASSTCSTPSSTCSSSSLSLSSSSSSSSIGSPHLSLATIKAATCQYTIEQIADAVVKFFISSWGQYPNESLLLGTLKAADENHKQICQQREEIINKETELQAKDSQLQEKDTVIQVTKTQLRAKDTQLQAKERELAQTRQNLQHQVRGELEQIIIQKDEQLEQKDEQLVQKDEVIEQNREVIVHKDEVIEEKDIQLLLKSRELEDLKRHIETLRLELMRKETSQHSQDDSLANVWNAPPMDTTTITNQVDGFPVARCTVCYSNPSQIVFQPCGHLCCCDQCASKLMGKKCPICRETNITVDKVYVM